MNYDYEMCSCTTWKRKNPTVASSSSSGGGGGGGGGSVTVASGKNKSTAASYVIVDSDQLCEDQVQTKLTADMFDGLDGVRVLEFTMTSVPDLDANSLDGLTSVELVQFSHVFLSSATLSSKVLCSLWRTLNAVRLCTT
jgi:hypothetical protein